MLFSVGNCHKYGEKKGFSGTGIFRSNQPINQDNMAIPMQARQCFQLSVSVPANLFNNSTITTCRRIMIPMTIQNSLFLASVARGFQQGHQLKELERLRCQLSASPTISGVLQMGSHQMK